MVDPHLITAAQRGDVEAFTSLVAQLRGVVTGLCFAELGDWDGAEDCAQEVFVRLHTRLHSLRETARFAGWLRTLVRNVCISEQRRPHRRVQSLEALEQEPEAPRGSGLQMREGLDRATLGTRLGRLVAQLPPTQRRVLVLRHLEELDIETIAALTDLTPASTRTMLCRARVTLRRLIEEQAPELKAMTP